MWSSKPKARVYTGFMGDVSEEQQQTLDAFRGWVEARGDNVDKRFDDYDYLRFCRGRKFVLVDIQKMWTDFIDWRVKEGINEIASTWEFPEQDKVAEIYPQFYHKTDKMGRPIYIERLGTLDVPKLFTFTTEERMMRQYSAAFELLFNWRYPSCSAVKGARIEQSFTILDMTGFSATMMTSQVRGLLQVAAKIAGDNYPENMGATYVTNAPFVFSACWSIVKGFLDERTTQKIKIIGGSFQKPLLEVIDAQNLPKFLGGECHCEKEGGCERSNAGPWNQYEQVRPFGIKAIGDAPKPVYFDMGSSPAQIEEKKE